MHICKKLSGSLKNPLKMVKESLEGESESPVLPWPTPHKGECETNVCIPREPTGGGTGGIVHSGVGGCLG